MIKDVYFESIQIPSAISCMKDCHIKLMENTGSILDSHLHWHTALEIVLILEGAVTYTVDAISHTTYAGDFHLINSRKIHSAVNANPAGRVRAMVLLISDAYLCDMLPTQMFQQLQIDSASPAYPQIKKILFEVLETAQNPTPYYNFLLLSLLNEMLYLLYTTSTIDEDAGKKAYSDEIIRYINEHYLEPLTLDDISRITGLQKNYICRFFKKDVGVTFKQYLNRVRLDAALALLSSGNHTASECAVQCGFSSEKTMINWCHKIYNTSPVQWIKKQQDV